MAATEVFANNPSTTVSSGGTNAGTIGTIETWTVANTTTGFPTATTSVTKFHVGDPAIPSELILVTNTAGDLWSVVRGAENTTPVAHAPGFTIAQVVSAGWLGSVSFVNPMTALGDMIYGGTSPTAGSGARLAGGTAASKRFLTQTGAGTVSTAPAWGTIATADVPVLNQNTTGTAATVSGTVTTAHGGTGLGSLTTYAVLAGGTSATAPVQQVAGAGTVGQVLTSNGPGTLPSWQTNSGSGSIPVPLTVNDGGTGGTQVTAYAVLTGGTSATAPFQAVTAGAGSAGLVLTSNGAGVLPSFQLPSGGTALSNPMQTTGDMISGGALGIPQRLAGNTASTKEFLTSTGSGGTANAPAWGTIVAGDVPVLNQNTTGTAATVSGTVATTHGGTGLGSVTAYAVVTGGTSATSPFQQVASVGTSGYVLTSQGAGSLPTWTSTGGSITYPITVGEGGTGGTTASAYSVLTGGALPTGAFQSVTTGAGSIGFVLTTNGTNTLPSWQKAPGSTGLSNPMTGTGDMITGGADGVATRLGNPTTGAGIPAGAGLVLASNGTGEQPSWQAAPVDWINVQTQFGAGLNGDATAAINDAIAALPKNGGTLYFPAGNYSISNTINLSPTGTAVAAVFIGASGNFGTQLLQSNGTADSIAGYNVKYFVMQNITLSGPGNTGSGCGINLYQEASVHAPTTYIDIYDCRILNFGADGIKIDNPIVTRISHTVVSGCGGNGFNINAGVGGTSENATSVVIDTCYALECQQAGYQWTQVHYSSIISSAADGCGAGYILTAPQHVALVATGTEALTSYSAGYTGNGFVIDSGLDVTVINPHYRANIATAYWVTGNSANIQLISPSETTPASGTCVSIQVDSGSYCTVVRPDVVSNTVYNGQVVGVPGVIGINDTNDRWNVSSTGVMQYGSGAATPDTNLYRGAANVLQTDDSLNVGTHALGQVQPGDQNLLAWAFDPAMVIGGQTITPGTQYLVGLYVNQAVNVTNIYWSVTAAAGVATTGQNFVGLVQPGTTQGTLLRSTEVSASITTTGLKTTPITSQAVTPGLYWVVMMFNYTGAALQIGRQGSEIAGIPNVGLTNGLYRFATCGATKTSLGNFPITLSANVLSAPTLWAGIGPG